MSDEEQAPAAPPPFRTFLLLPPGARRHLLLLVLLCDTPNPAVRAAHGTYGTIFTTLFRKAVQAAEAEPGAAKAATGQDRVELTIESYDVVQGAYPSKEQVQRADGVLLTGSAASAYDPLPWISTLTSFVASLPTLKPSLKIFGICFGHQIVARAFGGEVIRNPDGWEIGVRKLALTDYGKAIFPGSSQLTVHQMHRDHVPALPPGFELLGSTPVSPIQGMIRVPPSTSASSLSLPSISIITFQGHPEFSPDIVQKIIDARETGGVISHELAEESRAYAQEHDEGVRIGRVLLAILGV